MISPADIALWVYATVLSLFVAFLLIVRGQFRRFAALGMYFVIESAVSLLRMRILSTYGISSTKYGYFYYYSDLLLSILLYFVVASLFQRHSLPLRRRRICASDLSCWLQVLAFSRGRLSWKPPVECFCVGLWNIARTSSS